MTKYVYTGILPIALGFCSNEKSYHKQLKKAKIEDCNGFCLDGSLATLNCFLDANDYPTALICVDMEATKNMPDYQFAGLIAHEASHVLDYAIEKMREKEASGEFKAYTIQFVTQQALEYFLNKRKK